MDKPPAPLMHLGYLDGLRAVTALFVVVHHALLQIDPHQSGLSTWRHGGPLSALAYGYYAVDMFIVLSGFCLMLPVVRGDGRIRHGLIEFFKRRAWRILPPYYLAMLFSMTLAWLFIQHDTDTHWNQYVPITTGKAIVTHLVLLHDVFGEDHSINHVFWSIAVEWRLYFLFPLLVWSWRRAGAYVTTALAVICSVLLFKVFNKTIHVSLTINFLGLFALGMFAADVAFSKAPGVSRIKNLPWGMVSLLFLALIVCLQSRLHQYLLDYLAGVSAAALLIMTSLKPQHPVTRLLNNGLLVFVGTFAYSLYLIHAPLLQILWQLLPALQSRPAAMFAALAVLGTPIIVGVSYLFFLVCEKPFLQKKIPVPRSIVAKTAVEPAP